MSSSYHRRFVAFSNKILLPCVLNFQTNILMRIPNTAAGKDNVAFRLQQRQYQQKTYFDPHAGPQLCNLNLGQPVHVQDSDTRQWLLATVTGVCQEPRSYNITTELGTTLHPNRRHLKPLPDDNQRCAQTPPPASPKFVRFITPDTSPSHDLPPPDIMAD